MNVMGAALSGHFKARVEQAAADPAVKGVVVTSGKSSFLAGADLKEIGAGMNWGDRSKGEIAEAVLSFSSDLRRLETCGKPFACAVNGTALGAGFEIALACHYRVVADDPKILLGLPEANVGLLAGGGRDPAGDPLDRHPGRGAPAAARQDDLTAGSFRL